MTTCPTCGLDLFHEFCKDCYLADHKDEIEVYFYEKYKSMA